MNRTISSWMAIPIWVCMQAWVMPVTFAGEHLAQSVDGKYTTCTCEGPSRHCASECSCHYRIKRLTSGNVVALGSYASQEEAEAGLKEYMEVEERAAAMFERPVGIAAVGVGCLGCSKWPKDRAATERREVLIGAKLSLKDYLAKTGGAAVAFVNADAGKLKEVTAKYGAQVREYTRCLIDARTKLLELEHRLEEERRGANVAAEIERLEADVAHSEDAFERAENGLSNEVGKVIKNTAKPTSSWSSQAFEATVKNAISGERYKMKYSMQVSVVGDDVKIRVSNTTDDSANTTEYIYNLEAAIGALDWESVKVNEGFKSYMVVEIRTKNDTDVVKNSTELYKTYDKALRKVLTSPSGTPGQESKICVCYPDKETAEAAAREWRKLIGGGR